MLIPEQFSFREMHSSTHELMRFVEIVTEGGCQNKQATAFFLDVEKDFNRVLPMIPQPSLLIIEQILRAEISTGEFFTSCNIFMMITYAYPAR